MLDGYKTYIAAIAALLTAIGATLYAYSTGQAELGLQALVSAFIALALLFLRKSTKTA